MKAFCIKGDARRYEESLLKREAAANNPHQKHFGKYGKHHGRTKGAFGKTTLKKGAPANG